MISIRTAQRQWGTPAHCQALSRTVAGLQADSPCITPLTSARPTGATPEGTLGAHRLTARLRSRPCGRPAEYLVDDLAGAVLGVRPQVRVGVERIHRALVPQAPLHHLDALAVA
jgi:hypothetical protein